MSVLWWLVAFVAGFAMEAFIIGPGAFGGDAIALTTRLLIGGLLFGVIFGVTLRIVIGLARGAGSKSPKTGR